MNKPIPPHHKDLAKLLGDRIAAQHWERAGVVVPRVPTALEFLRGRIASNHDAARGKKGSEK